MVVASLLHVTNGWTKQSVTISLANGEEGDFKFKVDELFNNDFLSVAAHACAGIVPTGLDVGLGFGHALTLTRRTHHGFDDHWKANGLGLGQQIIARFGVIEFGCTNPQTHCHIANAIAVHGEVGRTRTGDDFKAFLFDF